MNSCLSSLQRSLLDDLNQSMIQAVCIQMMSSRLTSSCLATLVLIGDQTSVTGGFKSLAALTASDPRYRNERKGKNRMRVRARSSPRDTPEDAERVLTPPPKRRLQADIDALSMERALLNLDLSGGIPGQPDKQQRRDKESVKVSGGDKTRPSKRRSLAPGPQVLTVVQRCIAQKNVVGAISALLSEAGSGVGMSARGRRVGAGTALEEATLRAGFTIILKECSRAKLWREAKQVLTKHMPTVAVEPSDADWLLAIDDCAEVGGTGQAICYLHDMRMRGLEINRPVYTAVVLACASGGEAARALFLVKEAAKRGTPLLPSDITAAMRKLMVMPGSRAQSGWSQALALHDLFFEIAAELLAQATDSSDSLEEAQYLPRDSASKDLPVELLGWTPRRLQLLSGVVPGWEEVCQAALEACRRGGDWSKALAIFNTLRVGGGGIELREKAFEEVIVTCGGGGAWDMVLVLIAEMRSDEISMSHTVYNVALKACAATGSWAWARSLLSSIASGRADGVPLTRRHYLEALQACATVVDKSGGPQAQGAAKAALELLQDLREARWLTGREGEDAYLHAMKACVAGQDAWGALALLESAEDDGVWCSMALRTAAMQACSGASEWRAALSILEGMLEERLLPSGEAYGAAMTACARGGMVDLAFELLERVLTEHPDDQRTRSAGYHGAIAACAECGHWEGATTLLQRMRQDSMVAVTGKAYKAAIAACCRAQQSVAALTLLGDMSMEGGRVDGDGCVAGDDTLLPDELTYVWVMRAFGREGRWRAVMELFQGMRQEVGLEPSVSAYNVVVEALARAGEWRRSLEALEEMKREGVRPTEFTYTNCMIACGKNGQWEQTLSLMSDMKRQGDLVPDRYVYSTAMMACSRSGRLDDVLAILEEMRNMPGGGGPNVVNYNIAIAACARARDWERVMEELDRMRWEDVTPNETTFLVPLDVCGRWGELSVALALLSRMREDGIQPGLVAYGASVAAACRAGEAGTADRLLDEMEAAGQTPNEVTYGVAALACRDGANADAAVGLVERCRERGLPLDPLVVSFAVQACARAGDLERGLRLISDMKTAGLVPDCSFYTGVIAGISASLPEEN